MKPGSQPLSSLRCFLFLALLLLPARLPALENPATNWTDLSTVSWDENRVDVFARGSDDSLQHKYYDGVWHEWESLRGILRSGPAAVSLRQGHLNVFVRGGDDAIWENFYRDGRWQGWLSQGGNFVSAPQVFVPARGQLELFAETASGTWQMRWWDGEAWHPWQTVGKKPNRIRDANAWFLRQFVEGKSSARFHSRFWKVDDGLPHDTVLAITQTRDGYLWIGTAAGLTRFDGIRFTTQNIAETSGGYQPAVTALHETKDGSLWIGTEGRGLIRLHEGNIARRQQRDGLAGDSVRVLHEGKDGSLWIGTTQGLSRWQDGKFHNLTEENGLRHNTVRALVEDRAGDLWAGTGRGLNLLKNGEVIGTYLTNQPYNLIRALALNPDGSLWVGCNAGIFRWQKSAPEIVLDGKNGWLGLSNTFVTAVHLDGRNNLWVGTYGGLCRLAENGRSNGSPLRDATALTNAFFLTELTAEKTAYDQINVLFEDREGSLWVGAKDGLHQLKDGPFTTCSTRDGLSYNNVMSVLPGRSGGLWVSTWGGGLNEIQDGRITVHASSQGLHNDLLLALHEDREGALWIGADFEGGLYRFQHGRFTHYGINEGFTDRAVRVIYQDSKTNLWIGTSTALTLFQDGKFRRYTTANGLVGNTVRAIHEDRAGHLWIGTSGGLSRYRDGKFQNFTTRDGLSHDTVMAIHEDKDGTLWLGTAGGLSRLRQDNFTFFDHRDGLWADEIYEILEDDQENLWMSSRQGIFRVSKKKLNAFVRGAGVSLPCVSYDRSDGMESAQCNGVAKPAGWKGQDGRLWFATTRGVVVVDPNAIRENEAPPPVVMEEVMVDKKPVSEKVGKWASENASLTHSPTYPLTLPPGRGELEFHYTVLSFRAPEKNRFKYKLEGIDPDWVDAGTRRVAYYNNIKPGDYTFHVIACNHDGVWNLLGENVKLSLQPHYWQTWWFKFALTAASFSLAAAAARYATRKRMQFKLERLEQQHAIEKERTRIAQDMHDDLGARLTQIMFLSGVIEKRSGASPELKTDAGKVAGAARDVVQSLDTIVWAVNPRNDAFARLAPYLHDYADRFLGSHDIRCRFQVEGPLPSAVLSSETRHNLVLVTKEALTNIAKHAACTEVQFDLRFENDALVIVIADNGQGFSLEAIADSGNGLHNMEERIKKIGGRFEISSELGKGTRLRLQIPIPLGAG